MAPTGSYHVELGIDYGTSSTRVVQAIRCPDGSLTPPTLVKFNNQKSMPSCLAIHSGEYYFGHDVDLHVRGLQQPQIPASAVIGHPKLGLYERFWTRNGHEIMHMKAVLGGADDDANQKGLTEAISKYLAHIVRHVKKQLEPPYTVNFTPDELSRLPIHARLCLPQMWSPVARRRMQTAAQRAGIDVVTLASEPQATIAQWLDTVMKKNLPTSLKPGSHILIADIGCGTGDFVLFKFPEDSALTKGSSLRAVEQSTGALCGSHGVTTNLIDKIVFENSDSVKGAAEKLRMEAPLVEWLLYADLDRMKLENSKRWGEAREIMVSNRARGQREVATILKADLEDAFVQPIAKTKDKIRSLIEDRDVQFMLFTGGMSRSDIFFPEIEEEFAKNGTVVSRLEDEDSTIVAFGALSARYDTIDVGHSPTQYGYAVLHDEEPDRKWHPDLWEKGPTGRWRKNPNKVKADDYGGPERTIDRLQMLIPRYHEYKGPVKERVPSEYYIPVDKPVITDTFVYTTRHFENHESALVDDHDITRADNKFRKGVHLWENLEATLNIDRLLAGKAEVVTDGKGKQHVIVSANLVVEYKDEANIAVSWHVLQDPSQPYRSQLWDARLSEFSEHDVEVDG